MIDEEFVGWIAQRAPTLAPSLAEFAAEWDGEPPQTLVCIYVLVPEFINAVTAGASEAALASELGALFEDMMMSPDRDLRQHAEITVAPAIADHAVGIFDAVLAALGPTLRSLVSDLREVVEKRGGMTNND
jgi:hypothetical protein